MNRFCELVGCRLPIQQAGMTRVTTPALVAAVAEAGGLGMLAVGRQGVEATKAEVDAALTLTTGDVAAMAFYAGTGVGAVTGRTAAAPIVAELSTAFGAG